MKAYIILKCDGHQKDGFNLCSGVSNTILDLEPIRASENYVNLIEYLDNVPKLFNGPCFKSHIISNTIYKIYEYGYLDDIIYKYIAYFYEMHKRCGLILECIPK